MVVSGSRPNLLTYRMCSRTESILFSLSILAAREESVAI